MALFTNNRRWVYTQNVTGRFQRIHRWAGVGLQAFLLVVPWITVGGHPAARIDVPARRVYALGAEYGVSDAFLLVLFGLGAAFTLFFLTSLFGRVWCGYLCPQSVFLEEWVRRIENWIEGERGVRKARDNGPWTFDKVWRKVAKLSLFALVAFFVSMAFESWFAGASEIWTGRGGKVDYALVGIFTGVWFADFAWFREQFCNYLCPYARFQGALADDESLVVTYDPRRGEPRGGKAAKTDGRCIDCNKCVAVCPAGIDIRDGYQLECITCARCVDACEGVMGKLGHPTLISYSTVAATEGRKPRLVRPRTVLYGGLLTAIATMVIVVLASHQALEATVEREPGSLFTVDPDGSVRNTYLLRVANHDDDAETYTVTVEGLDAAEVVVPEIALGAEESRTVPLVVRVPPGTVIGRTVKFNVHIDSHDEGVVRPATFKTPTPRPEG